MKVDVFSEWILKTRELYVSRIFFTFKFRSWTSLSSLNFHVSILSWFHKSRFEILKPRWIPFQLFEMKLTKQPGSRGLSPWVAEWLKLSSDLRIKAEICFRSFQTLALACPGLGRPAGLCLLNSCKLTSHLLTQYCFDCSLQSFQPETLVSAVYILQKQNILWNRDFQIRKNKEIWMSGVCTHCNRK